MSDSSRQFSGGAEPLRDFGFGKGQEDFSKTGGFEFATAKFDDTAWLPGLTSRLDRYRDDMPDPRRD